MVDPEEIAARGGEASGEIEVAGEALLEQLASLGAGQRLVEVPAARAKEIDAIGCGPITGVIDVVIAGHDVDPARLHARCLRDFAEPRSRFGVLLRLAGPGDVAGHQDRVRLKARVAENTGNVLAQCCENHPLIGGVPGVAVTELHVREVDPGEEGAQSLARLSDHVEPRDPWPVGRSECTPPRWESWPSDKLDPIVVRPYP